MYRSRLNPLQLMLQLRHASVEALDDGPDAGGNDGTVRAMMAGGGVAFDGIIEFPATGAAGARTLGGGRFIHRREQKLETRNSKLEGNPSAEF
jgi:hypothetical protein